MFELILGHLLEIVALLASAGMVYAFSKLRMKVTPQQLEVIDYAVRVAVLYVQQTKPNLLDENKLSIAISEVVNFLAKKGIKLDLNEVEVMVEAKIIELKAEFKDLWKNGLM